MSEGRFSQPRPHRDEERQIEDSFRQLTEEKNRRHKKVYTVEEDISRTVLEISAQEVSLPESSGMPFARSAKLEETILSVPGQTTPLQTPPPQPRQKAVPQKAPAPSVPVKRDFRVEEDLVPPKPVFPEQPVFTEEAGPEEESDFIDKLLNLGSFFRRHQTPVILGLCGAAVLLIVFFVSIFFTGGNSKDPYGDVILPNVYIADIPVGGMTRNEAMEALQNATADTYSRQDMVIDLSGTEISLSPKDTGAQLDVKAAAEAAFTYGRTGSQQQQEQAYQNALRKDHIIAALPFLQLDVDYIRNELNAWAENTGSTLTQTTYGLEGDEPKLSADLFDENASTQTLVILMGTPGIGFDANDVYEKVLDAYSLHQFLVEVKNVESVSQPDPIDLEAIYEEFYIAPVNASVNLQTFETKDGSYGYGFDLEAAQKLVDAAQPGEVLRIPMEYIPPEILSHDAFFQDSLGQHQTRGTGNDNRNHNLKLACSALNGTTLNPGETLSFSAALTKVSGFRMAPEDTGLEDSDQGGVTQVASTLYYAAMLSDLNISSRNNHKYLPSFIDYGMDATKELKLVNSTGYPIRIDAEYSGGYVKVEIWGTEERDYYVMLESSISSSTAAKTVYEDYPYDNEEGYRDGDVIEEGSAGYLVKSYKVKYDRRTGRELSRDFITNSQYPAVNRIVARVEKPVETEPPTEPTQPPATTTPPETTVPPETTQPVETTEPTQPPTEAPAAETQPEVISGEVSE